MKSWERLRAHAHVSELHNCGSEIGYHGTVLRSFSATTNLFVVLTFHVSKLRTSKIEATRVASRNYVLLAHIRYVIKRKI